MKLRWVRFVYSPRLSEAAPRNGGSSNILSYLDLDYLTFASKYGLITPYNQTAQ